jgi:AcrR family transcriptional regulator
MPTGVALRDPRQQLFDAAERVLLRDGASGLTSRAVTDEAGVAKGVLHRHFVDFDEFLTALVLSRIQRVDHLATRFRDIAGSGTVDDNLAAALTDLFEPVMVSIVVLIIARDELRARLRSAGTSPFPLIGEGTAMVAGYLAAERGLGRIARDCDVDSLAPTLVGAAHLLCAEHKDRAPDREAIRRLVATVLAGATVRAH